MSKNLIIAMLASFFAFTAIAENSEIKAEVQAPVNAELKPDREAVNSACAEESKIAGCGDAVVGGGLLKCIHTYKKAHKKEFKVSDSCKESMRKLKSHRMEIKEKRQEKK